MKNTDLEFRIKELELELSNLKASEAATRHRLDSVLTDREGKFKILTEMSVTGIYIIQDGKMVYVNPSLAKTYGYSADEIIGKMTPEDLIHPDDSIKLTSRLGERLAGKIEDLPVTYKAIKKDGTVFYIDVYGMPIEYLGRPAVMGTLIDITETRQAEKTLLEIIDNNPMSIQILDKEGYTFKVNQSFMILFGSIPPSDYSMFNDIQLKKKGFGELIDRLKSGGVVNFPDMSFNPHDSVPAMPDVTVWVRTTGFPLIGSNGMPEKYVFMHDNITERKLSEYELKKRFNEMQRLHDIAINRELKMVDLKQEINELLKRLGEKAKYKIVNTDKFS
jgi:PAS domain S-box-containing protein